jgi:hypothetical protein
LVRKQWLQAIVIVVVAVLAGVPAASTWCAAFCSPPAEAISREKAPADCHAPAGVAPLSDAPGTSADELTDGHQNHTSMAPCSAPSRRARSVRAGSSGGSCCEIAGAACLTSQVSVSLTSPPWSSLPEPGPTQPSPVVVGVSLLLPPTLALSLPRPLLVLRI